jgi:hypothetical protein
MTDSNLERKKILFEGFSDGEILNLPAGEIEALVLTGQPIVFRAGSATVLGEFRLDKDRLVVELAQIDGGGEGVLVSLWSLVTRYARLHKIDTVEWIVHAVNCAKPNPKLRQILDRRGFIVRDVPGIGEAYYYLDSNPAVDSRSE